MASHRKPRTRPTAPRPRTAPAVGLTTAALTSVALLSQSAQAAPSPEPTRPGLEEPSPEGPGLEGPGLEEVRKLEGPSLEEVRKKVDDLYHQAGVATQKYNSAKEKTDKQRRKTGRLLDDVAQRADKLNEARQKLGSYATAQYRTGAASHTAAMMLADDPQGYFDQNHLAGRLTARQKKAVDDYQAQQASATKQRARAARSLETLSDSRDGLRTSKRTVQKKLGEARELLSELTAEEKARLAAAERKREREAAREAVELSREQAAEAARKRKAEEAARKETDRGQAQRQGQGQGHGSGSAGGTGAGQGGDSGTGSGSGPGSTPGSGSGSGSTDSGYSTKAAKVVAFARAQLGKPYVWGATGPDSYDCSGLTQDAWKAAGISLPRTTWDQAKGGTTVRTADAEPGDLVFFYDDLSHVGIYIGDGKMIHAPRPGTNVRVESIHYMPLHRVVRPV
ncbi:NlpC/P60 family protein [Streptomyces sp. NPDC005898]|uniref:C40 family peptidase n=1 Tax=Streptomyces sp. NPDC005898 TaxID=3157082 RepID=UPI0033D5BCD4